MSYLDRNKIIDDQSLPFPDGVWTQMTLVKNQEYYSLYFDNILASSSDSKAIIIRFGDDVYLGGDPWLSGATGA